MFPQPAPATASLGGQPKVSQAGYLTHFYFQGVRVGGKPPELLSEEGPQGNLPLKDLAQPLLDGFCQSAWVRRPMAGGPSQGAPRRGRSPHEPQDLGASPGPPRLRGPPGARAPRPSPPSKQSLPVPGMGLVAARA